jgi:hypothetical protein
VSLRAAPPGRHDEPRFHRPNASRSAGRHLRVAARCQHLAIDAVPPSLRRGETFDKWTKYGQLSGDGCVYPSHVATIAARLSARHLMWKSYDQDMGNDPVRDGTTATAKQPQVSAFGRDVFTH